VLDPGPETALHYDSLCAIIGDLPEAKRAEARQLLALVADLQRSGCRQIELRFVRNRPLLYNFWLSTADSGLTTGHLTFYFRGWDAPSFRVISPDALVLRTMATEFGTAWTEASPLPSDTQVH